jgi:peptidoglycan/LPS O-acetylase OafA/YrhL
MQTNGVARVGGIDGLRGLAAAVVLVHHSLLVVPEIAEPFYTHEATATGAAFVLLFTPAHLLWVGTEAVFVFFVISGFVLTRWVRRDLTFSWLGYGLSRAVRLYGPVIAALAFAAITIALVPRDGDLPSRWLQLHDRGYDLATFARDALLVTGDSGIVSPLWSLRWEIVFSVLLPLVVLLVRPRVPLLLLVGCGVLVTVSAVFAIPALAYLPAFVAGAVLAEHEEAVTVAIDRAVARAKVAWLGPAAFVVGLLLLASYWLLLPVVQYSLAFLVSRPAILAGAVLVFLSAIHWRPFRTLLSSPVMRRLGAISFSLYLVHEPVIVALAYLTGGAQWAIPLGIVLALVIAYGFWWLIEKRIHRFARFVTRRFARKPATQHA